MTDATPRLHARPMTDTDAQCPFCEELLAVDTLRGVQQYITHLEAHADTSETDEFETWVQAQQESARDAYKSPDDARQPLGDGYELGIYHAYQAVLAEYRSRNPDGASDQ